MHIYCERVACRLESMNRLVILQLLQIVQIVPPALQERLADDFKPRRHIGIEFCQRAEGEKISLEFHVHKDCDPFRILSWDLVHSEFGRSMST